MTTDATVVVLNHGQSVLMKPPPRARLEHHLNFYSLLAEETLTKNKHKTKRLLSIENPYLLLTTNYNRNADEQSHTPV